MSETECELQQLVLLNEELNHAASDTEHPAEPSQSPKVIPRSLRKMKPAPKLPVDVAHHDSKRSSFEPSVGESSNASSKMSRIAGNSSTSTYGNTSTGHVSLRVQHDHKPPRPPQPNLSKLQKNKVVDTSLDRQCQHHYFLSDVTDVREMEKALLRLLEDFHTGKLRAFGKGCSMEQMTAIHEQQERLARLHFELGAQQELFAPLSEEGLRQGEENMKSLMDSLEELSLSIERLHSINSTSDK